MTPQIEVPVGTEARDETKNFVAHLPDATSTPPEA